VWQTIREELYSQGLEIVTVALDILGLEAAGPFIQAAKPTHPSLIDQSHLVDELFGISQVPTAVWIDEQGVIVRPPETAFLPGSPFFSWPIPDHLTERIAQVQKLINNSIKYLEAVRDWVTNGAASRYALKPEEVIYRSRPRPIEEAQAAAHFELGQFFQRNGQSKAAIEHFRETHRLQPTNWTYKRQAWSLVDPAQGPTEYYESDYMSDIKKFEAEDFYKLLDTV
jgi:hypothetical protein